VFFDTLLYHTFHNVRSRARKSPKKLPQHPKIGLRSAQDKRRVSAEERRGDEGRINIGETAAILRPIQGIRIGEMPDNDIAQLLDIFLVYVTYVEDRLAFAIWWHKFATHFLRYCYPLPSYFDERIEHKDVPPVPPAPQGMTRLGSYGDLQVVSEGEGDIANRKEGKQADEDETPVVASPTTGRPRSASASSPAEQRRTQGTTEEDKMEDYFMWKKHYTRHPLVIPMCIQHSVIAMLYEWLKDPYHADTLLSGSGIPTRSPTTERTKDNKDNDDDGKEKEKEKQEENQVVGGGDNEEDQETKRKREEEQRKKEAEEVLLEGRMRALSGDDAEGEEGKHHMWSSVPQIAETIFRICEECCSSFQKGLKNLMPTLSLALNTFYHLCWVCNKSSFFFLLCQVYSHYFVVGVRKTSCFGFSRTAVGPQKDLLGSHSSLLVHSCIWQG